VKQGHAAPFDGLHAAFVYGFDDSAAGGGKHDRFDVVPSAGERIYPVALPQIIQKLVARITLGKINQNHLWPARNIPAAHAAFEILGGKGHFEGIPHTFVCFFKAGVFGKSRAKEKVILAKLLYGLQRLAADHRKNTAHLVADFPAHLKQRDRGIFTIHVFSLQRPGYSG